jgi:glycosyltransferase involved in cell wall biosynthesis
MNALVLAEDFHPTRTGGAFVDWQTARYLADRGDNVTVVTPRFDGLAAEETIDGVEIHRPYRGVAADTPQNAPRGIARRLVYLLLVVPYVLRLARTESVEVVYSTNFLLHPVAALLCSLYRIPHVSFVGFAPSIQQSPSIFDPLVVVERLSYRFVLGDQAVCRTRSVAEAIARGSSTPVERLDGILDPAAVRAAAAAATRSTQGAGSPTIELLYVGRLADLKNVEVLPGILADLPSAYEVTVIGTGPRRAALEAAIAAAGVEDRVTLAGERPHADTLTAIAEADLLVVPSAVESYGAVAFEALALRTPVVTTPVGVFPDVDHPKLTTVQLEAFPRTIRSIDDETDPGVDEDVLEAYSVERFAEGVRRHLRTLTRTER